MLALDVFTLALLDGLACSDVAGCWWLIYFLRVLVAPVGLGLAVVSHDGLRLVYLQLLIRAIFVVGIEVVHRLRSALLAIDLVVQDDVRRDDLLPFPFGPCFSMIFLVIFHLLGLVWPLLVVALLYELVGKCFKQFPTPQLFWFRLLPMQVCLTSVFLFKYLGVSMSFDVFALIKVHNLLRSLCDVIEALYSPHQLLELPRCSVLVPLRCCLTLMRRLHQVLHRRRHLISRCFHVANRSYRLLLLW